MSRLVPHSQHMLEAFPDFTRIGGGVTMRSYQLAPAAAILKSIRHNLGLAFVVILPRQAGKDELLAHLKAYLMRTHWHKDRGIVEVNPTYKPQTINAMLRLENRMDTNLMTRLRWRKRSDFLRMIGRCRTTFLSGDGQAHVLGATADLCLIVNEAQDISPAVYARNFAPMAASRAATRLFCGTVWTSNTLLAQMQRTCREAEKRDGLQRVFLYTAEDVRRENPAYGVFVDGEVQRMGRNHPFIKTQYFCEEIDAQAGMFPPGRQALMHGSHLARTAPACACPVPSGPGRGATGAGEPEKMVAFLVDVAGQDECNSFAGAGHMPALAGEGSLQNPGRDSTFLKIVEIDLCTVPMLGKPTYKVVFRRAWTGEKHVTVFGALCALASAWRPRTLVIDATGVGEGLWSLLDNALGSHVVLPVKFTPALKSELGYGFLAIVESGRYQEYRPFDETLREQLDHCLSEILPGPAKLMRWGVPDGTRSPTGGLVHDDDLITGALCVILDRLEWRTPPPPPMIVPPPDPLNDMDRRF